MCCKKIGSTLKTCWACPMSEMCGFGKFGGSWGSTITWTYYLKLFFTHLKLFIRELAIPILVSEGKHLGNVVVGNVHRKVLHDEKEILLQKDHFK